MTAVHYSRATLLTVFPAPDGIGIPARDSAEPERGVAEKSMASGAGGGGAERDGDLPESE